MSAHTSSSSHFCHHGRCVVCHPLEHHQGSSLRSPRFHAREAAGKPLRAPARPTFVQGTRGGRGTGGGRRAHLSSSSLGLHEDGAATVCGCPRMQDGEGGGDASAPHGGNGGCSLASFTSRWSPATRTGTHRCSDYLATGEAGLARTCQEQRGALPSASESHI